MVLFCPSCSSDKIVCIGKIPFSNYFAGRIFDQAYPGGSLYRCNTCQLAFRWPRLPKEDLNLYYREGYVNNWQYKPEDRRDWQIAVGWLKKLVGKGRILDVGCFDGNFLSYLGEPWEKYGIELHEAAVKRAKERGIHILANDFTEIDQLSNQFDAVVAYDFIEHMEDPRYSLKQMAKATRSNGFIIISTGNTDSPSSKFMGNRYWYYVINEHISFINKKWCNIAARALNLQIQHVERFSHAGKNRNILQIVLQLFKNIVYKYFPHWFGWLRSIGMGKIDIAKSIELKSHPPNWMSAKDHFIVIFRKN